MASGSPWLIIIRGLEISHGEMTNRFGGMIGSGSCMSLLASLLPPGLGREAKPGCERLRSFIVSSFCGVKGGVSSRGRATREGGARLVHQRVVRPYTELKMPLTIQVLYTAACTVWPPI